MPRRRRRRNFIPSGYIAKRRKAGWTRQRPAQRRLVWSGRAKRKGVRGSASGRRTRRLYTSGTRKGKSGWRTYHSASGRRPLKSRTTRKRKPNPSRRRSASARKAARTRRANTHRRSAAARRGARTRRRGTRTGMRRRTARRAYRRSNRRGTRAGMRRRTARRAYRRSNQGFVGALPRPLQPIGRAVMPGLLGAGGLALSRFAGNAIAGMFTQNYQANYPRATSLISGAITLGVAGMVLPKIKALQPPVRNAILVGFAIDFGLRIIGALLPAQSRWRDTLVGLPSTGGFGYGGYGGYSGFGQPDIYEAGMLGENAYDYQYSPVQGGVGAYIADPSALVPGREEFQVEVSGFSGGIGAIGAYVADPQALRSGPGAGPELPVEIAPAGFGAYVADPQALRSGPGAGPELPVEIAPAGWGGFGDLGDAGLSDDDLSEVALDAAEAGAEGLGALNDSLRARGGRLLYSTTEGSANLAKKGYDVEMIKSSAHRHPGVPIVSATRAGSSAYQCPHCAQHGQAPQGTNVFRCWSCGQAITSAPGLTATSRQSQLDTGATAAYLPPPSMGNGGMVGRPVPSAGTFQPLYAAGI